MKVRMRFSKIGPMKFIGHLDLMRFFQKAFRRANIDVAYSKGYSPHQLLSFASPLTVGATTDGDYLDVELNTPIKTTKRSFMARLNQYMTEYIFITDIIKLPDHAKTSMSLLYKADYEMWFRDGYCVPDDVASSFEKFMSHEKIIIMKKTKRSVIEMDIKPHILAWDYSLEAFQEKTGTQYVQPLHRDLWVSNRRIYLQLTSGSEVNIKPQQVIDAYLQSENIVNEGIPYQMHRMEMYFKEIKEKKEDE